MYQVTQNKAMRSSGWSVRKFTIYQHPMIRKFHVFLVMRHRKSAPFQVGANFELLSARLQDDLRFFRHPLPAVPSPFLTVRVPLPIGCGAHRAYPVDCCGDALRLGWELCSRWGLWVLLPAAILRQSAPRYHFGHGLSASLAASD